MIPKKWMAIVGTVLLVALLATGFYAIAADYGSNADPLVSLSYINDVLTPALQKEMDTAIAAKSVEFEKILADKIAAYEKDDGALVRLMENNYKTLLEDPAFMDELATAVAKKVQASTPSTPSTGSAATFTQVTIPKGKTMYLSLGCEVLLRLGTGTCVATGVPGLIDMTNASVLPSGSNLAANHLYLVSVQTDNSTKRGIAANSGDVTVMVLGSYTIQ